MATTLATGTFAGSYSVAESYQIGFTKPSIQEADTFTVALGNGTSAGNMNLHWEGGNTTTPLNATTGGTTYTLSAMPADGLGRTCNFTKICAIWLRLTEAAPAGYIKVEPGTNAFPILTGTTPLLVVNRAFFWADDTGGITVTSSSADQIKLTASTGTIKYIIGFAGIGTY